MTMQHQQSSRPGAWIVGAVLWALTAATFANDDWQPMPSERLIKLPAPVMAKAIEKDFRQSPIASQLRETVTEASGIREQLGGLTESIAEASDEEKIDLQHRFLEKKSAYLDVMEARQALKQEAIEHRIRTYNGVLDELQRDRRRANDPVSREVREAQLAARERMERVTEQVDDMLYPASGKGESDYNREYAHNIDKIKALRAAIRSHGANQNATVDGVDVSREDFIRNLLADSEAELALLHQENEMLGYMARLVALDAQALQMQVAYGEDADRAQSAERSRPADMVDYFIN